MDEILDVAKNPDEVPRLQQNGRWRARGVRGGVEIVVLIEQSGEIHNAYPARGPGVVRNPDQARDPANPTAADLEAGRVSHFAASLLERLADRLPADDLAHYRSLHYAGEWDELADVLTAHVRNVGIVLTDVEREELRHLIR